MRTRALIDTFMKLLCLIIIVYVLGSHGDMKMGFQMGALLIIGTIWIFTPIYDEFKLDAKRGN